MAPALVAVSTLIPAMATAADDGARKLDQLNQLLEQQQSQIEVLRREIENLRNEQKQAVEQQAATQKAVEAVAKPADKPAGGDSVATGDFPGSWKIPGTDVSFKIGGYLKADYIQSFGDIGVAGEDLFVVPAIPTRPTSDRGGDQSRIHARQTRLNFDVRSPTPYGQARGFLEFDLFDSGTPGTEVVSNRHNLSLRHAIVELGPLLAGQYWSTFNDPSSYPETFDFEGPGGESFIRQGQVRWTQKLDEGLALAVAVENSESQPRPAGAANQGLNVSVERVPDFIAHLRREAPWGHVQAHGLVREVKVERVAGVTDDSTVGWGVGVSGKINTPWLHKKDNVKFQFNAGDGIGRYILDLAVAGADSTVNEAGEVVSIFGIGGYGAVQHWWSDELRSTLVGSYVAVDNPSSVSSTSFANSTYLVGNMIWSPIPRIDLGVEGQWGRREDEDGASGDLFRLQGSAIFRF